MHTSDHILIVHTALQDDCYRLSIILESIYKLRNSHFIGPVSILQNLTVLSLTNSKTAVDIIGSSGAGDKYATLCRWLVTIPSEPPGLPDGDMLFIFDNEQIVGKTWNINSTCEQCIFFRSPDGLSRFEISSFNLILVW